MVTFRQTLDFGANCGLCSFSTRAEVLSGPGYLIVYFFQLHTHFTYNDFDNFKLIFIRPWKTFLRVKAEVSFFSKYAAD